MKIKEIPYQSVNGGATELSRLIGLGWSAPIKLPLPARLFGAAVEYFNISEYGALRFAEAKTGKYHFWPEDGTLPESLTDFKKGFILVPWGEPQRVSGCGKFVNLYSVGDRIVINYKTVSKFNSRQLYMYQVQIPTLQPNIVEYHYYNCQSGYNTYVGAIGKIGNIADWPVKELQPYHKKALLIDTGVAEIMPVPGPEPIDPVIPGNPKEWVEVASWQRDGSIYQVRVI